MEKRLIILSALIGLLLSSCVKDDTVTIFKELNEIEISGIDLKYTSELQQYLTINPVIKTHRMTSQNYLMHGMFIKQSVHRVKIQSVLNGT